MAAPKFPLSFRISQDARALLELLTFRLGLNRSAVLELAVRRLADEWGVEVPRGEVCGECNRKRTV